MIGPKPEDPGDPATELESKVLKSTLVERLLGDTTWVTLGRFELRRMIGRGGMGVVFEALDTRSGQPVALKVLRLQGHEAASSIKREFRAVARAYHRNLVGLHELFTDQESVFFTMELIHGSSIREYVICHLRGDREHAARLYGAAADQYERLAMRGYVQMCRLRQSELLVGAEAEALRATAERWFADQGICRPRAWTRMFAPIGDAG